MDVPLETISNASFSAFGQLVEADKALQRRDFAASIQNFRKTVSPNLALLRSLPFNAEPVAVMERHSFSSQLFVPLDVDQYLILVARDDGADSPDFQTLRAFRVSGRQAVNYFAGTWHMNMATLGRPGVFVMMIHEDGTPDDCEFRDIDPVVIKLDVST